MTAQARRAIVGNSLAALVAARECARGDCSVMLINGSKGWGGHFTTYKIGDTRYDLGMVLHEFTSFSSPSQADSLASYSTSVRNDVGRFAAVVRDYVARFQQTRVIKPPEMYYNGRRYGDLMIANQIATLPQLPFASLSLAELRDVVSRSARSELHPTRKTIDSVFSKTSLCIVSYANHGRTLHESLIEPACRKLLNRASDEMVALYHRAAWLPLYYPETLVCAIVGPFPELPKTDFSYPQGGCVGDLSAILAAELNQCNNVEMVSDRPLSLRRIGAQLYEITLRDRGVMQFDDIAWANSASDLLSIVAPNEPLPQYQKASIALAFARVDTCNSLTDFSVLNVPQSDLLTTRITNQTCCAGQKSESARLVLECNLDYAKTLSGTVVTLADRFRADLLKLGVVKDSSAIRFLEVKEMPNALTVPSFSNLEAQNTEAAMIKQWLPDIHLLGQCSGFFTSSFNDQVIQGLRLAGSWSMQT